VGEMTGMSNQGSKNQPFGCNINVQACAIECMGANREEAGA